MTNEKGFATILGLCLILVIALIVKGIQESEMNHAYETTDFKTELDLQNAADSGIYAAAALIHEKPSTLPLDKNSTYNRKAAQNQIIKPTKKFSLGDIYVEVWGERVMIKHFKQSYSPYKQVSLNKQSKAYILFSKAEVQSKQTNGKLYRRSFAYVLFDENNNSDMIIHFMELPSSMD